MHAKLSIVGNDMRCEPRICNTDLDAIFSGAACIEGVFCCVEDGWDSDVVENFLGLLMEMLSGRSGAIV